MVAPGQNGGCDGETSNEFQAEKEASSALRQTCRLQPATQGEKEQRGLNG